MNKDLLHLREYVSTTDSRGSGIFKLWRKWWYHHLWRKTSSSSSGFSSIGTWIRIARFGLIPCFSFTLVISSKELATPSKERYLIIVEVVPLGSLRKRKRIIWSEWLQIWMRWFYRLAKSSCRFEIDPFFEKKIDNNWEIFWTSEDVILWIEKTLRSG